MPAVSATRRMLATASPIVAPGTPTRTGRGT
nr:MAG TPA: hypothetical protein [Caudoviricetes sp.]